MPSLDTYLNLCTQVYDLSKPKAPQDAYEFYRSYAVSANGLILEPMCGTGRFLLPLIAENFNVHGYDASKRMLDVLHLKAKEQNLKVKIWQGLVEDIKLSDKYDLIFIPSGSFGLITNLQVAKNVLKIFYDLLTDEGTLIFEAETLKAVPSQPGIWRGSVWTREDGQLIIANFLELPLRNNICSTVCRYELVASNVIIKTEIEVIKVRLYEPKNLFEILTDVGFMEIKMIKAFDRDKLPDRDDEIIIYECKKMVGS